MTVTMATETIAPVQKSVVVSTSAERAFKIFTEGFDSWWPRGHHIGKGVMTKAVIEGRLGGSCYGEEADGTKCPWGEILVWEPPRRFVLAWKITPEWTYQPDLTQASEVEVRFTPLGDSSTRVDLEHRNFDRMGAAGASMRTGVDSPGGWGSLMQAYAERVAATS